MQPTSAVQTLPLAGAVPHDLSIFALFLQADAIVKIVMLILLLASFWSWAVIFDKVIRLRRLHSAAANFEESFWSGGSLDDLYERVGQRPPDPMTAVFSAAMREWRRSAAKGLLGTAIMRASLQQRIERVMNVTVGREMERVERFMAFLATVGRDGAVCRAVRHGLGDYGQLPVDCRFKKHQPCGRRARHRRIAVRDSIRSRRRHSGGGRLQQARDRFRSLCRTAGSLCVRIQRHLVPPA